jgi:hypothetical protein
MWHTHQIYPLAYLNDTVKILGYLFPHDDSVNDRKPGSKLSTCTDLTRNLWIELFNEPFHFSGGMFRGLPPSKDHFSLSKFEPNDINLSYSFQLLKQEFERVHMIDILDKYTAFDLAN